MNGQGIGRVLCKSTGRVPVNDDRRGALAMRLPIKTASQVSLPRQARERGFWMRACEPLGLAGFWRSIAGDLVAGQQTASLLIRNLGTASCT